MQLRAPTMILCHFSTIMGAKPPPTLVPLTRCHIKDIYQFFVCTVTRRAQDNQQNIPDYWVFLFGQKLKAHRALDTFLFLSTFVFASRRDKIKVSRCKIVLSPYRSFAVARIPKMFLLPKHRSLSYYFIFHEFFTYHRREEALLNWSGMALPVDFYPH